MSENKVNKSFVQAFWLSWRSALIVTALLFVSVVVIALAHNTPPSLNVSYGDTSIHFSAERAWSLFPGDCIQIQWQLEGIESLYVDGEGKIGWGEQLFCPQMSRTSPLIEVRALGGIYRQFRLPFHFLPDLLLYLTAFLGTVGTILLALYYIAMQRINRPPPLRWLLPAMMLIMIVGTLLRLSPVTLPVIDEDDGQVAVHLWAEQERLVFPRECVEIGWSVAGANFLRVNDVMQDVNKNPGHSDHCTWHGADVTLEATAATGEIRRFELPIPALFESVADLPVFYYCCLLGLALALLVFAPLAVEKARSRSPGTDSAIVALGGFAVVVFLLYLPFGLNNIPQLETWYSYAYFDGQPYAAFTEHFSRFWIRMPHALTRFLNSESFISFHLMHIAIFICQMTLVYAICRKLNVRSLYAFLVALLFMLYPVNSGLLSSRTMVINSSTVMLLLAVYCALDYLENPRRRALAGVLLALLIHVVIYEASLALILAVPLLLRWRKTHPHWRDLNLTIVWYIAPVFKLAYMALLAFTNRPFYGDEVFEPSAIGLYVTSDVFNTIFTVLGQVLRQSFITGWAEAMADLGHNSWWLPTLIALTAIGGVAAYLARQNAANAKPTQWIVLQSMLGGLILIPAAIGVFIWLPLYSGGDWRLYTYVPIGAAIAVLSLLLLLTAPLKRQSIRDALVIAFCLLLFLPAFSRLLRQNDQLTRSAQAKARILHQILEIVPRPRNGVDIVLMTQMDFETMKNLGISELVRANTFDSAMFTLYQEHTPRAAVLCITPAYCSNAMAGKTVFDSDEPEAALANTLFLELRTDLEVGLIHDPIAYFNLDIDTPYDSSRLYDPDAPLPPRAQTMLGAASQR